jgi:cell division protein ZapE
VSADGERNPTGVAERYRALVAAGEIEADAAQAAIVARLDQLAAALAAGEASRGGFLSRLLGGARPAEAPKGVYVWGEVGRGKTMLMDLFFDSVPDRVAKRRVHFNGFMNDAHERIFAHRNAVKAGTAKGDDPIVPVADGLAAEARLLCFDEFSVTDIADAMILGRLFTRLFADGVTVVATSNVEPRRLYEGGLNRALFLPFIDLLERHMEVMRLEARTDYRLEKLSAGSTYVVGLGQDADRQLDAAFRRLTGAAHRDPRSLAVKGRNLVIPQARLGVARASFADLCEAPLGPADFLAIAATFHTLVLDHVPVIDVARRDVAKRFITLIDSLYDRGVKLVVSAAAEPSALYPATEGREAFEFQRTASRLVEMRSEDYLARPHAASHARDTIAET